MSSASSITEGEHIRNDNNTEEGGLSLSTLFDDVYTEYLKLCNPFESTNSPAYQENVSKVIGDLEELTRGVSAVDMFTKNEHYEGLSPEQIKFLLLPFFLGTLWTLRAEKERATSLIVSQTYFQDFLERCTNYEFIERKESDDEEEVNGEIKKKRKPVLSPAEKRDEKIKKLKRNYELDRKIQAYRERLRTNTDVDDFLVRELFVSLIRRSINDAEDQLQSIEMELELIKFGSSIPTTTPSSSSTGGTSSSRLPSLPREKSKPLKPFIITKDATQKKVFGVGYPSLPVMTVEELYEQRRAQGQWAPPPSGASGGGFQNPEVNQEEAEAHARERLEEADDEENLARQRAMDEYKDDHRRGWGNRFNRS